MKYTIRSNRNTNHLYGVSERGNYSGEERGGSVQYYADNACGAMTRALANNGLSMGDSFGSLADAITELERPQDRSACKVCLKAARAQFQAEQDAERAEVTAEAVRTIDEIPVEAEVTDTVSGSVVTTLDAPMVRCVATAIHAKMGIPAVTEIEIPGLGESVPACQQCADYVNGQRPRAARVRLVGGPMVSHGADGKMTIHGLDMVRGPVDIEMDASTWRWVWAQMTDLRRAQPDYDDGESR
jgi:hypothetical protein